jgi:redox-sensitive bicupin YhaK (pirin superfamily)
VIDVRRAADRALTTAPGLSTRHSFSFGVHYDPGNVGMGALVAHNEEWVAPGQGYDWHEHAGVEIVTWVAEGVLLHEDSTGMQGQVRPGQVQRLSAGTGVRHAERNASTSEGLRFVQSWLRTDEPPLAPSYEQAAAPVVRIGARGALRVARLPSGTGIDLPEADRAHLFVVHGGVIIGGPEEEYGGDRGTDLQQGDAVRLAAVGRRRVTARNEAELLLWEVQGAA